MGDAQDEELVLVTGASGFVGSHVVQELLEGGYRVRAAVRDPTNQQKVDHLIGLVPQARHGVEIIKGDLGSDECWVEAVKGCAYVIHVASPFPQGLQENDEDLVELAVEGTLNVLKACDSVGTVKRVVLTSSVAAICGDATEAQTTTYTEDDWTNPQAKTLAKNGYIRSKICAEKAAWNFMGRLAVQGEKLELAVINPGGAIGPVLGDSCSGGITNFFRKVMEREVQGIPRLCFPLVDVRDVAVAHVRAMTHPEAAGKRHIVANYNMWLPDLVKVVSAEFKPQGYNISTKTSPDIFSWVKSVKESNSRFALPSLGKVTLLDNTRMRQVLGITPRNIKDAAVDMVYSLIEKGFVKKSKGYRGLPNKGIPDKTVMTSL